MEENFGAVPGTKRFLDITLSARDGCQAWLPIYVVQGEKPGPTLCLTAGVHGTEYPGIEAALRLYYEVDPKALAGRIIGCPFCNFSSFRERSMFVNPLDGKNLNYVFPGRPDGTITEVIADFLLNKVVALADYHIDLHSGDVIEDLHPFVFYHRTHNAKIDELSARMAKVFGMRYVAVTETSGSGTSDKGNFYASVAEAGIPSIQAEAGGLGLLTEEAVNIHLRGIKNVLMDVKMVPGDVTPPGDLREFRRFLRLRSEHDGIFYPLVRPGQEVHSGDLLARITDYRKEKELARLVCEGDGVVLWIIASPAIKAGDALMAIGISD